MKLTETTPVPTKRTFTLEVDEDQLVLIAAFTGVLSISGQRVLLDWEDKGPNRRWPNDVLYDALQQVRSRNDPLFSRIEWARQELKKTGVTEALNGMDK